MNIQPSRRALRMGAGLAMAAALCFPQTASAETQPFLHSAHVTAIKQAEQEYWSVTNEIKTKIQEGQTEREIEAYDWDIKGVCMCV